MSQSTSLIHVYDQLHDQIKKVLEKQFFFVVGCQKSGTTWLEKILDNHPEMICRGEAVFGNVLAPALNQALVLSTNRSNTATLNLVITMS